VARNNAADFIENGYEANVRGGLITTEEDTHARARERVSGGDLGLSKDSI
jgi:hypothetical protein